MKRMLGSVIVIGALVAPMVAHAVLYPNVEGGTPVTVTKCLNGDPSWTFIDSVVLEDPEEGQPGRNQFNCEESYTQVAYSSVYWHAASSTYRVNAFLGVVPPSYTNTSECRLTHDNEVFGPVITVQIVGSCGS